jgi:hypothetical protein
MLLTHNSCTQMRQMSPISGSICPDEHTRSYVTRPAQKDDEDQTCASILADTYPRHCDQTHLEAVHGSFCLFTLSISALHCSLRGTTIVVDADRPPPHLERRGHHITDVDGAWGLYSSAQAESAIDKGAGEDTSITAHLHLLHNGRGVLFTGISWTLFEHL